MHIVFSWWGGLGRMLQGFGNHPCRHKTQSTNSVAAPGPVLGTSQWTHKTERGGPMMSQSCVHNIAIDAIQPLGRRTSNIQQAGVALRRFSNSALRLCRGMMCGSHYQFLVMSGIKPLHARRMTLRFSLTPVLTILLFLRKPSAPSSLQSTVRRI